VKSYYPGDQQKTNILSDKHARMSDMDSTRISVRISRNLTARLRARSNAKGISESNVVREALEEYLRRPGSHRSAYELAIEAGVIGTVDGPRDLSTNRRYLKGFGKRK
jgi:predicted DNA-binding protein